MVVSVFIIRGLIGKRNAVIGSNTHLGFHSIWTLFTVRHFASNEPNAMEISTKEHSFTVNYLIHSCGLSVKSAKSVSKKVQLKSRQRSDSFLDFLKRYGFTDSQVSKIVRSQPHLLLCNFQKSVLPKLEFFSANGIVDSKLTELISKQPIILSCSLEKRIIPGYNFLKGVLVRDDFVVKSMSRSWTIPLDVQNIVAPNVSHLREIGLPQSLIIRSLKDYPSVFFSDLRKFEEKTKKVIDMGFSLTKMKFVLALGALVCQSESKWDHKIEVYQRWGWSEDDVLLAYKKEPICMLLSEKKITGAMEFFISKMNLKSSVIAAHPDLLFYSLKKRIIPRFSVIKILRSKKVLKRDLSATTLLKMTERHFLDNYVIKYQDHLPQLSDVSKEKDN
uniref:Uncharacterized protein LOC105628384 n=1 Tax=Rhizophora mucronata TaxID=61149 RepID=A0A2P2K4K7_RHIMU